MNIQTKNNSDMIKQVALFFSLSFLAAAPLAALYTGEWGLTLSYWFKILTSPCPLVTDYYMLGNLASAFFNAGICGLSCTLIMILTHAECRVGTWAGFFLVIAHCFYGLNFVNMWPPILGIFLFCKVICIEFRDNLDMAMFSTAFGPFVSELLFRYPLGKGISISIFGQEVSILALIQIFVLVLILGFAIPAMLPGAQKIHKGFNLYNGGLAFGLLGLLIYSFMYKTVGVSTAETVPLENAVYEAHGYSYGLFCNIYFLLVFGICLIIGLWRSSGSLKAYRELLTDSGYRANFLQKYGISAGWINLGIYGLFMLLYFDLVIYFTSGAGFTGATCGVILAAMTFAASGQHPKNVWPIILGFILLAGFVSLGHVLAGRDLSWTLSTQGYLNGIAFATGLCPFAGKYGWKMGVVAGVLCAIMCTTTSVIHGGFVLYNGGLTAGITALILTPFVEFYSAFWEAFKASRE